MKKLTRSISLFFLCLLLSACGFYLRGYEPMPCPLRNIYLHSNNCFSPLTKYLQLTLCHAGVHLAPNAMAAPVTLLIISDNFNQSATSVGSSRQVTTYLLTYSVTFQLLDSQGVMIHCPQTVMTTRSYSITSNQILGDTNAIISLQEDMRRDVIFQILNRLRSPEVLRIAGQM